MEEDQRLIEFRAAGVNVQDIADALNRTNRAVRSRTPNRVSKPSDHPAKNYWSDEESDRLVALINEGQRYKQIAHTLNRTISGIKARVRHLKLSIERPERKKANAPWAPVRVEREQVTNVTVPDEVMADRNRRLMAQRDLTAILMGDPPRGFSSLERRRA